MGSNVENDKPWKEQLASFLKDPTRRNLRNLLQLEAVEDNDLEFKRELLPFDLLAKHILAMANKDGGAIVFGVEETNLNQFSPCGLSNSFDITDIEKKLEPYVPKKLEISIIPTYYKGEDYPEFKDKLFLIIIVKYNPRYVPFIALKSGENLKKDTIYIRRNRASEPINYDELQEILNNRIETEYSTTDERKLIEHLEELKELYNYIPKSIKKVVSYKPPSVPLNFGLAGQQFKNFFGETEYETLPNPDYPEESYEGFIKRLIEIKKDIIIKLVKKS
uniref:AAA-4 family protein n=1 Tax=Cyanothece sp. (strain PCC 7425 / ATCC 29141) TaxID=395961 RepID=B8HK13_CYAP4